MTWHPDMPDEYKDAIVTGDAKELAKRIPDESIDLVFSDPVYWEIDDYRWLAETAARVLVPDSSCLAYCGNVQQVAAGAAMLPYLRPRPVLGQFMMPPYPRLFDARCHVNFVPLLWFTKGRGVPRRWILNQYTSSYHGKMDLHYWDKNIAACFYHVEHFSSPGEVVYDPFSGGGTVPAICKMLGRHYIASEINPDTAERARRRVEQTQPPLFVPEPEQLALEVPS